MSLFRGREWRKASWEQWCPSAFLSDRVVAFHPYREDCSLCLPAHLHNTSCTLPDTCLLRRLPPPAAQRLPACYTTLMKWKRTSPNCLTHLLDSVAIEKGLQSLLNCHQFWTFY